MTSEGRQEKQTVYYLGYCLLTGGGLGCQGLGKVPGAPSVLAGRPGLIAANCNWAAEVKYRGLIFIPHRPLVTDMPRVCFKHFKPVEVSRKIFVVLLAGIVETIRQT